MKKKQNQLKINCYKKENFIKIVAFKMNKMIRESKKKLSNKFSPSKIKNKVLMIINFPSNRLKNPKF
jgi:hypothetical protein